LIAQGIKKELSNIASGAKKLSIKPASPNTAAKPPAAALPSPPAAPPVEPPPVKEVAATTTPIVKATTTPAAKATTTPIVKATTTPAAKATTTPIVKATTTPATTTPVVKAPEPEPEPQQTVVRYVVTPTVVYPDTTITASPATLTSSTAATFAYSSDKAVVIYEYKIDGGNWISAGNSTSLSGLAEGNHVFMVRSTDSVGPDPTPAQYDWRVDLTAPVVSFASAPASFTNQTSAAFEFGANELVTYHYKLDAGPWLQTAGASTSTGGLAEGAHKLSLYGVDSLGFQGATIEANWLVDLLPPSAHLDELPSTASLEDYAANGLNITFGGSDQNMPGGSGVFSYDVEYATSAGEWQQWNQGLEQGYAVFGQQMTEGQIVDFRVRARDAAGNLGDWGDSRQTRFASTRPNHLVLSEVQISGDSATDEFVELFNPTDDAITLSSADYVLSVKNSSGNETTLVNDFMNMQIDAHGYILVASADYSGGATPDISYPSSVEIPSNATVIIKLSGQVIDKLGFGAALEFERAPFADNPGAYESLERKAVATSSSGTMVNGAVHNLAGNGYDSNSNVEDFVMKIQSDPQNVDSGTELLARTIRTDLQLAMSGAASLLQGAWFSLVRGWINPARLEALDGFVSDMMIELKSKIADAQLAASTMAPWRMAASSAAFLGQLNGMLIMHG
jgi:hypothetical protein